MISAALLFKLRVIVGHVALQPVRPQFSLRQNTLHGGFADFQFLGQLAARPMPAPVRGLLLSSADHSPLHRRCRPARFASLMAPLQAFDALLLKSDLLLGHRWCARAQRLLDLRGRQNANLRDGPRPHAINRQFERQQSPVKGQRTLKLVEKLIRRTIKAPAPELVSRGGLARRAGRFCAGVHFAASLFAAGVAVAVTGKANRLMKPSASFGL